MLQLIQFSTFIGSEHTHTVLLTPDEMSQLKGGRELQVNSKKSIRFYFLECFFMNCSILYYSFSRSIKYAYVVKYDRINKGICLNIPAFYFHNLVL